MDATATSTGPNVVSCRTVKLPHPVPFTFRWTIQSFSVYMYLTKHVISPTFEDPAGNLWAITVIPSNMRFTEKVDDILGDISEERDWFLGIFLRLIKIKELEKEPEVLRANLTIQTLVSGGEVLLSDEVAATFSPPTSDSFSDYGFNFFVSWATLEKFYSTYVPQDILRISIKVKPCQSNDHFPWSKGIGQLAPLQLQVLKKQYRRTMFECLIVISTTFRKILEKVGEKAEKSSQSVISHFCDYDPNTIKSMIEFGYTGKLQKFDSRKHQLELLKLAKVYGFDGMVKCIELELENLSKTSSEEKVESEELKPSGQEQIQPTAAGEQY